MTLDPLLEFDGSLIAQHRVQALLIVVVLDELFDVRTHSEVVIEHEARPVAVVRPAEVFRGRLLSESITLAEAHAKELGYEPTMDWDFAADLREIINSRKPRDLSAWE